MSYQQDDPYFDAYSNVTTSQNTGPKGILRRTSNIPRETNIFEPSVSPSSCYDSSKSDSHWRTVNSKIENAQPSSLSRYGSSVSNMPSFSEEHGNSNYQVPKFSKNINAELYAKAIAAKSNLGLLAPNQSSSSSALEALRSYDSDFQTPSTSPPYNKEWSSRHFQSDRYQSSDHFQMQSFSPKHSKTEDTTNELYQQVKAVHTSVPKHTTKLEAGSMDLISGFSSIEDEDQFLYGDSNDEDKKNLIDDSPPKTNKNSLSNPTQKSIHQDSTKSSSASTSIPEMKIKDNMPVITSETHAIDLKLQPNVWKNPSIWDMPSGEDIFSNPESVKEKKGSQLFDDRHEQIKRQKLDIFSRSMESNQSTSDRNKISSDKKFDERISSPSNIAKKDYSNKFVPLVIEKNNPPRHSSESTSKSLSKFHHAAEMLKAHLTSSFDAEKSSGNFKFQNTERAGFEKMPSKFQSNFETKNEVSESATGSKFMPKIEVNVEQGEIFSSKRTVRVKHLLGNITSNQPPSTEDLKHDEFVKTNTNIFSQHQRVVRSKFDDSPEQNVKDQGSPEKDNFMSLFEEKFQTDPNPVKNIINASKAQFSRSRSNSRSRSPNYSKKKTHEIHSSDELSTNSKSSTPHSSDSGSSRHCSPGSKSPIVDLHNRSPKRYAHKSYSPNRDSRIPRQYSRRITSPRRRSPHSISPYRSSHNAGKYPSSKDKYVGRHHDYHSPGSPYHGRRSRSPRRYPSRSYSKRGPDRYYKRKSPERSPTHKYPKKASNDYKGDINPVKKTSSTKQIMSKKVTKPCNEMDVGIERSKNKVPLDPICDQNAMNKLLPQGKLSETTEAPPSVVADKAPVPDEKVAELAAFFRTIQKNREMFSNLSYLANSQNTTEKSPQLQTGSEPSGAPIQEINITTPVVPVQQYSDNNRDDGRMFYQQPYPYAGSAVTNPNPFPMNYQPYPNINASDNSQYNLYNAPPVQQIESYYQPPDQIPSHKSRKNLQKIQLQTFNKLVEPRVCSLKEIPVLADQKPSLVNVEIKPQQKEFIQPEKKQPNEGKSELMTQKIKKELSDKELKYEELYKKILEQQDTIQRRILGTQKDITELRLIKQNAEKKMFKSRSVSDKQYLLQTTELIEQAQEELRLMIEQAEDVEKDLSAIKLKIACLKEKGCKVESESLKPSNVQPIKFKISSADTKKTKAESKPAIGKKSNEELVIEAKEKSSSFGAKILPVKEECKYSCYDPGSHWCQPCNELFPSIMALLEHLQSNEHKQLIGGSLKPWLKDGEEKKENNTNTIIQPVKGIQFLSPVDGFYCSLCKEVLPDKTMSEKHLKGHNHTEKYFKFIKENPVYERRYDLSKTAGLSQIYKARKKREVEEKYIVNMKRKEKEKEVDMKAKKVIQKEKNREKNFDELEEIVIDVSSSPKSQKSSGIKLTLVNEKDKTTENKFKDASEKPKQIVYIGRAPNFKPKLNMKSDLKNRIENSNKRKEDHLHSSSQNSKKSTVTESVSADADLDLKKTKEKSSEMQCASKKFKCENFEGPLNKEKVSPASSIGKAKDNKASKPVSTTISKIPTVLNKTDADKCESSQVCKDTAVPSNVKKGKNQVAVQGVKKRSKVLSTKQVVSTAVDVSVPLVEIKLPVSLPKKSDTSPVKELKSSVTPSLTTQSGVQSTTSYQMSPNSTEINQSLIKPVKTPIQKVRQNVLLTEEERDFLLLGINKDDMAPLAVPRPPPSLLIQSHKQHKTFSSAQLEICKKNLPPFPPPLQVPPPNLVMATNMELNITNITVDNYAITDMEIDNEITSEESKYSSSCVEAKVTDVKQEKKQEIILLTEEQDEKSHDASMDILKKEEGSLPQLLHVPPSVPLLKELPVEPSSTFDSETENASFSNTEPKVSIEIIHSQTCPSTADDKEISADALKNSNDNNAVLLNTEPLNVIKDDQETNNDSTNMEIDNKNDNLENTSISIGVNAEISNFPTVISSTDMKDSLVSNVEGKCNVETFASSFEENVNDKITVSHTSELQSPSTTESQLDESQLHKNEESHIFATEHLVNEKPEEKISISSEDSNVEDVMSRSKMVVDELLESANDSLKTSVLIAEEQSSEDGGSLSLENQNVDHKKRAVSEDCNLVEETDALQSVDNLNLLLTEKGCNLKMETIVESGRSSIDSLNFVVPVENVTECVSTLDAALPTMSESSIDAENKVCICKESTDEVTAKSPIQDSLLDHVEVTGEIPQLLPVNIVTETPELLLVDNSSSLADQGKTIDVMKTDIEANKNVSEDLQSRNMGECVENASFVHEEISASKKIGFDYSDTIESNDSSAEPTCFAPHTNKFASDSGTVEVCIDLEPKVLESESHAESAALFVPCLEKFDIHDSSLSEDHSNPPIIEVCEAKLVLETNEKITVEQSKKDNISSTTDTITQKSFFEEVMEKNCSQVENIDHTVAVEMDDMSQKNQATQELINEAEIEEKSTAEEIENKVQPSLSEVIEIEPKIQVQEISTESISEIPKLDISEGKQNSIEESLMSEPEKVKSSEALNDSDTDEYETDA